MSPTVVDHYERLGLTRDATARQVARAFRRAARTAHPDAGGTAADFGTLAEAFRVLSNPIDRAEYDRELDGSTADWDDVGWGMEVAGAMTPGGASDGPVHDDAGEGWDEPRHDDDEGAEGEDAADPWLLDPLVGGPRRIPDPLAPRALPVVASISPGRAETALGVATWLLLCAAVVLRFVGASIAERSGTPIVSPQQHDPRGEIIISAFFVGCAALAHSTSAPRSSVVSAPWILTVIAGLSSFSVFGQWSSFEGALVASSALVLGSLGVGIAWAWAFRDRRLEPSRVAALRERDRTWVLDRYHRAVEWNRVRAALLQPGHTVVVVGAVAADLAGTPVPDRRWTYDPRTGAEAVRDISSEVPHGSWVVVDDEDWVVATAPPNAPEAWLDALRAGSPLRS